MTGGELIDEGRRLARPCVYLRTTGEHLAAIWGGEGIVPCGEGPYRHWLSIDTRHITEGQSSRSGCLSIYTNEEDCETGVVAVDDSRTLPKVTEGLKLYAHHDSSFPPLEAVFKFGSSNLTQWLASNQWKPEWGCNDNFPDRTPVDMYEREYRNRLPLFSGDAHVVIGGWHMPWPDEDWDDLVGQQLIAWTFAESEPWVEVWQENGNYRVIQRIT